jgi:hypothetical protein
MKGPGAVQAEDILNQPKGLRVEPPDRAAGCRPGAEPRLMVRAGCAPE